MHYAMIEPLLEQTDMSSELLDLSHLQFFQLERLYFPVLSFFIIFAKLDKSVRIIVALLTGVYIKDSDCISEDNEQWS